MLKNCFPWDYSVCILRKARNEIFPMFPLCVAIGFPFPLDEFWRYPDFWMFHVLSSGVASHGIICPSFSLCWKGTVILKSKSEKLYSCPCSIILCCELCCYSAALFPWEWVIYPSLNCGGPCLSLLHCPVTSGMQGTLPLLWDTHWNLCICMSFFSFSFTFLKIIWDCNSGLL